MDSDADQHEISPSISPPHLPPSSPPRLLPTSPLRLPPSASPCTEPPQNREGNFPRDRRLSLLTQQIMLAEDVASQVAQSGSTISSETADNDSLQNELIFDIHSNFPTSPGQLVPRPDIDWDDMPPHCRLPPGQYSDGLDLRYEAEGLPPRKSYLPRGDSPSPFDGKPLHVRLEAEMIDGNGKYCLPLHPRTIKMMSPYYEGEEPIGKSSVFECMMINIEINDIHIDHWNAILGMIGRYCTDLIIVAPIFTTDLGSVFRRDLTDFGNSNDWEVIFQSFPYLETLTWEHPEGTSTPASRGTLLTVHRALAGGRCLWNLETFKMQICEKLCKDFLKDVERYDRSAASSQELVGLASHLSLAAARHISANGFRMWKLREYQRFI